MKIWYRNIRNDSVSNVSKQLQYYNKVMIFCKAALKHRALYRRIWLELIMHFAIII